MSDKGLEEWKAAATKLVTVNCDLVEDLERLRDHLENTLWMAEKWAESGSRSEQDACVMARAALEEFK
jgi:hypothetical protein